MAGQNQDNFSRASSQTAFALKHYSHYYSLVLRKVTQVVQCATVSGHPKAQVPCCTAARLRRVSHDVRASSSLRRSHAALACFQAPIHCHVCTLSPIPRKNALIRPFLGPFREYIHRADAEGPGFAVTSKLRDKLELSYNRTSI